MVMQVFDVTGKKVLTEKILAGKGFNIVPLDISALLYGVYHMQIFNPIDGNSPALKARFVKMVH
jgi:hypothetical protein